MAAPVHPHTASELADAEVIRLSLEDPEWFAELYDRHHVRIHHYAARRLGNQAADDIVAETFLVAFRRRCSYDLEQPMARPWLYGIATNLIARHRRAEERYYRVLRRTGADPLPEPLADTVTSRVAAESQERRLAGALARLSQANRDVLLLVAWGELTYEEVAQALGVPVGTVRSRLHRARSKVRRALGDANPMTTEETDDE